MSRMPQIPAVDYAGQPGPEVEHAPLPEGQTARDLDVVASGLGQIAESEQAREAASQKQLEKALAEKQKILDTVAATRSAGDFEERLRGLADSLQQKHVDTPDKAPGEFLDTARQFADDAIKAAPNSAVALSLSQKTASVIDSTTKSMHSWAQARSSLNAKNDMTAMFNQATRGAEDQVSPLALAVYADQKHKELDPLFENLTKDKKESAQKLDEELAKAWVTAAGARDPVGTMRALDAKGDDYGADFLTASLNAEDRARLRREVEASYEGMGKTKEMQALEEAHGQVADAYNLLRTGDPKFSATMASIRRALVQKQQAVQIDASIPEKSRQAQLKTLDLQAEQLQYLDMMARKQAGWDPKVDEAKRTALNERHDQLIPTGNKKGYTDSLTDLLKFQRDASEAVMENVISRSTYDTWMKNIAVAMPKARDTAKNDTGWNLSWLSSHLDFRSPQQVGSAALKDLLDPKSGTLGELSDKQRNDAYEIYLQKLTAAAEEGRNVDGAAAQDMATDAAYLAIGKPRPRRRAR